jgi:succinate-acetate transporter protein
MEINPYEAPLANEHAENAGEELKKPSWFGRALGVCCFCIALFFLVISFVVPDNTRGRIFLYLVLGAFAIAFVLMGIGTFTRRAWLAVAGFLLLAAPLGTAVVIRLVLMARS